MTFASLRSDDLARFCEDRHEHGYELSSIWHAGTLVVVPHAAPELVAAVATLVLEQLDDARDAA